jgi:hypothetical protein
MKTTRLAVLIVAGAVALTSGPILADQDVRHVPDRDIPVPATVSPATQAVIARPLSPTWNEHPKSAEEWKVLIARVADNVVATLPDLRQRLGVKVEPTVIGGVKAYVVTPNPFLRQTAIGYSFTSMGAAMYSAPERRVPGRPS